MRVCVHMSTLMRVCVHMSSLLLALNFFLPPLRAQGECPIMDAPLRCGLSMRFLWLMRRRVELLGRSPAGSVRFWTCCRVVSVTAGSGSGRVVVSVTSGVAASCVRNSSTNEKL